MSRFEVAELVHETSGIGNGYKYAIGIGISFPFTDQSEYYSSFSCYFQGSAAISSSDLFGDSADPSSIDLTSDLINRLSFQVGLASYGISTCIILYKV